MPTIDSTLSTLVSQDTGKGDGATTDFLTNAYGALYVALVNAAGSVVPQTPTESTVLASAARTATANTQFTNTGYKGALIVIDVTLDPSTASITPHIEGYSTLGNDWYTILTGSAIADVGVTVLRVFPGATAVANLVSDDWLPETWRFRMAVADAESMTYSVNAILLP